MKINKDKHLEIINLYNNGNTLQKVAEKFNVKRQSIWSILKKYNINCRVIKHFFNENYFEKIDTKD